MASKRARSKDTIRSATGDVVEKVSMSLLIYEDNKMFIDRYINMKWKDIIETFSGTFEEEIVDCRVYVNIHNSNLY